ncbi:MAG: DNA polymerase III subunit delta' [Bradymonadia bacterium]
MSFDAIKGQTHATSVLQRALETRRLHHAYLFAGPVGVGKALVANQFAAALLCETPADDKLACGLCGACLRFEQGQHPDFHSISRLPKSDGQLERYIKIDQVRALQKALSFKAFEGRRRVVLIVEPECMTESTANALLKTLEEPGRDTHFVLVSDAAHRLLPTVISRCQRVRFGPLEHGEIEDIMKRSGASQDDQIRSISRLAEGSAGRAIEMYEADVLVLREQVLNLIDSEASTPLQDVFDLAEDLAKPNQRTRLSQVFHILRAWYRDMLAVKLGAKQEQLLNVDQSRRLIERAARLEAARIQARLERTRAAETAIWDRTANARLVLESLFVFLTGRSPSEESL